MSGLALVPNAITLVRVALLPWIVPAILRQDFRLALSLCFFAGLTDALDGFSARLLKVKTATGAYLDPIADKLLLSAVYISLGVVHAVPPWLVVLIFARDLVIVAGVAALMLRTSARRFPPTLIGKSSTVLQILTALAALALPVFDPSAPAAAIQFLIILTALVTAASGAQYIQRGWRMWRGGPV